MIDSWKVITRSAFFDEHHLTVMIDKRITGEGGLAIAESDDGYSTSTTRAGGGQRTYLCSLTNTLQRSSNPPTRDRS